MKKSVILFLGLFLSAGLRAQIIHVPTDYPTIQQAIDSASNGDTVLVAPGTYFEVLIIHGKNVSLASHYIITQDTAYISKTIIEAQCGGSVISFDSVDQTAMLCGFTIQGGGGSLLGNESGIICTSSSPKLLNLSVSKNQGTGVRCISSNPILRHVTITRNHGWDGFPMGYGNEGGGLHCSNSNPILEDVIISNNSAISTGGGIALCNSNPILTNVLIKGNSTLGMEITGGTNAFGGGLYCYSSNPIMINVIISNNSTSNGGMGAGIFCENSSPYLTNLTITDNTGSSGSVYCFRNSNPEFINSILWNKTLKEIFCDPMYKGNSITITNSDIRGGKDSIIINTQDTITWLDGNINADPLFTSSNVNPYALLTGSPCIDAGTPDTTGLHLPLVDLTGNPRIWNERIDMGAYEWNNLGSEELRIANKKLRITNWPNPVANSTSFHYELKEPGQVVLVVYNSLGQLISEPFHGYQLQGKQEIQWNAAYLSSGIYFYRLKAGKISGSGIIVKE